MIVAARALTPATSPIAKPFLVTPVEINHANTAANTQNWKNFHTAETVSTGAGKRKTNLTEIWT